MANEPATTITGNLTADPELRYTPTGRPVASFTIASTPRFPDRDTGEWKDGETWFVRCSAWGDMAENVAGSLSKGAAVIAAGRLRARTWETDEGAKRATVEMTVDDIGPSLRRTIAKVTKVTRERPANGAAPAEAAARPAASADTWTTAAAAAEPAAAQGADEPPF
jgi:single-strand DNA-binding protein